MTDRLIVFARYPDPGRAKTRLIPRLGAAGAADLYRALAEHTLARLRGLAEIGEVVLEVRFDGAGEGRMRDWLGEGPRYRPQGEGDLGARLARAFGEGFADGDGRIVAVGTDCPGLGIAQVADARSRLGAADAVFGPAADGGYYLVGLRREARGAALPALFEGIPWGGPLVLERSLAAARAASLRVDLLDILDDVDRPEDLPVWERVRRAKR